MDIYCGNCDQNIDVQTNEEFNKMFLENEKLKDALRKILEITDPEADKLIIGKWRLVLSHIVKLKLIDNIDITYKA